MTKRSAAERYNAQDIRAMADELAAHGLTTHLTDGSAGLDLTAVRSPAGKREAELIIDEEGYSELRFWNPPGTPLEDVTATVLRAFDAITGSSPSPGPDPTRAAAVPRCLP